MAVVISLPQTMLDDVNLTYQGTFSGFPSDFAYGNLNGDLGSLSTDIAIAPSLSGNLFSFKGKLDAKSFKIGKFLGYDPLGEVTLHTAVVVDKKDSRFNAQSRGISTAYITITTGSIQFTGTEPQATRVTMVKLPSTMINCG